jgi:peptide/nickel transport system substrate-binding protein
LALMAACGGDGASTVASSEPFCQEVLPAVAAFMEEAREEHPVPDDPRYGGTVVLGNYGEIADGMNVAVSTDYVAAQHQQFVNLMTLIDYDEATEPRPYLAESWEVAEDNASVTFHLRRDVRWHDGEQTDAHDVAFTYETVTDPATGFANSSWWDDYVQGPDGVEVVDDFTVTIRLRPHGDFLDPFRALAILPEHLLGDVPRDQLRQHPFGVQCPVGNGPFVFVSHSPQDRWVFEANPAFSPSLGGRPFIDRYVYRVVTEQSTLLAELLTEGIDIYMAPPPDQAEQILADPDLDLFHNPARQYVFVAWNARRAQLSDARVRRALSMGTNREEIVDAILQGYGTVANSGVPPFHWAYDESAASSIDYDPEAAAALLTEAGWVDRDGDGTRENEDGVPLEISIKYNTGNQLRQDIAEIMDAQLDDIGVAVRPEVVDWTTLLEQIQEPDRREFDGVVMGWIAEYKLDDTNLFHSERVDQPNALSGTKNPEIDRLLQELRQTVERDDDALALWREYQLAIMQEQPYTFFYFPERLAGVNKRVRDVTMDTRGEWLNIREWHLDPATR